MSEINRDRIESYFEVVSRKLTYNINGDKDEDGLYELKIEDLQGEDAPLTIEEINILLVDLRMDGLNTVPTSITEDNDCVLLSDPRDSNRLSSAVTQLNNLILSPRVSQVILLARMIRRGKLVTDLLELNR